MHFCQEEVIAILSCLAGIRLIIPWLKARWVGICVKLSKKHDCHDHECDK